MIRRYFPHNTVRFCQLQSVQVIHAGLVLTSQPMRVGQVGLMQVRGRLHGDLDSVRTRFPVFDQGNADDRAAWVWARKLVVVTTGFIEHLAQSIKSALSLLIDYVHEFLFQSLSQYRPGEFRDNRFAHLAGSSPVSTT